jgi:hypothetical protein
MGVLLIPRARALQLPQKSATPVPYAGLLGGRSNPGPPLRLLHPPSSVAGHSESKRKRDCFLSRPTKMRLHHLIPSKSCHAQDRQSEEDETREPKACFRSPFSTYGKQYRGGLARLSYPNLQVASTASSISAPNARIGQDGVRMAARAKRSIHASARALLTRACGCPPPRPARSSCCQWQLIQQVVGEHDFALALKPGSKIVVHETKARMAWIEVVFFFLWPREQRKSDTHFVASH